MNGESRQIHARQGGSDTLLRGILTHSGEGIFVAGPGGRFADANPRGCEMLGYARGQILKLSLHDLLSIQDSSSTPFGWDSFAPGELRILAGFLHCKSGALLPVEIRASLLPDGTLLLIVRNTVERDRAERLLAAFNRSAEAMAGALTPAEVFSAVATSLKEAGIFCILLPLDEATDRYSIRFLSLVPELLHKLEKLAGIRHQDFSFPAGALEPFQRARRENRAVLIENIEPLVRQVLPDAFKGLAPQLIHLWGTPHFIAAPMRVDDSFYGILSVESPDLTEKDRSSIMAFAHQLALSLRKIELLQQAQDEIAERRHAEETLRQSEQRYRFLFENMIDGFAYCRILLDQDGSPLDFVYLEVNQAFGRLTGMQDVIGKKVTDLVPGIRETNPELFEIYARVALTGSSEKLETFVPGLDIWFSIAVYSPEREYFVAVFENITEARRAADLLINNEKRFRALIENGLENISLLAADGSLIWASPSTARTLGYQPDGFLGRSMFELLHPDDLARIQEQFGRLVQQPGGREFSTFRMRHLDGTWRWMEASAANLLDEPSVWAVVLNYRDVTERLQAEQAIQQSEEKYRHLFENNPHPMWVYDLKTLDFLAVNGAAIAKYGYTREEFLGMTVADIRPADELARFKEHLNRPRGELERTEGWKHQLKDGTLIDVRVSSHLLDVEGHSAALVLAQDITQSKQAEARVQYLTRLYATISQVNQAIVRVKDRDELFRQVCQVSVEFGQFQMAWIGLLDQVTGDLTPVAHAGHEAGYLQALNINIYEQSGNGPAGAASRTGKSVFVDDIASNSGFEPWRMGALERGYRSCAAIPLQLEGRVAGILALYAPETGFFNEEELRLLEEIGGDISFALDAMELERHHNLVEAERLRLLNAIEHSLNEIYMFDPLSLRFEYVNQGALRNLGYSAQAMRTLTPLDLKSEFTEDSFRRLIAPLLDGEEEKTVFRSAHRRADGSSYPVEVHLQLMHQPGGPVFLAVILDITEREQANAALLDSETRYRRVLSNMMEGCQIIDHDWRYIYINDAAAQQGRRKPEELLMHTMMEMYPGIEDTGLFNSLRLCMEERRPQHIENPFSFPDGSLGCFELSIQPVPEGVFVLSIDITDRKRAEAELRASEEKYRSLFNNVPDGVYRTAADGSLLTVNPALVRMLGYESAEQLRNLNVRDFYVQPAQRTEFVTLMNSEGEVHNHEIQLCCKDGRQITVLDNSRVFLDDGGAVALYEGTLTDITERRRAAQRLEQQLNRITALRDIDRLITSSFDLRLTMDGILGQVAEQLGAEACSVLTLDPASNNLVYLLTRGLRENALTRASLRLGQGLAGHVAVQRRMVHYRDLKEMPGSIPEAKALVDDGFAEYYGVPLLAKGQLRGVLEVFGRAPRTVDPDWQEFLETLAGQAAIAIDSIQLFDGLNRSNLELAMAYDATIEGWSRALDLRDKETEGHTQRVTELTLQLARAYGMQDEKELTHLRWGALLHDIGKMGIPDAILLKPGPLTDEEWVLMREHPRFASDMLAPIQYLRKALDIPLYHHEKWDGTGYPRSFSREQIPLAARLFAIVDIWDALCSDRPYRAAWDKQRTLDYIQSLAGTHLDPQVVHIFFQSRLYEKDAKGE